MGEADDNHNRTCCLAGLVYGRMGSGGLMMQWIEGALLGMVIGLIVTAYNILRGG